MAETMSTPGFYPARPVIRLDGEEMPDLSEGLLSLLVEETTAGLYRCELTIGNWGSRGDRVDYLYFDRDVLDFGRKVAVEAGAGDAAGRIFEGRITALEGRYLQSGPPQILVLAEDRLQDLRMTRRTRTFEQVTDEEVFRQVAAEHSLRPDIGLEAGPPHRILAQVNQSDLAFLRERARALDAELWVEGETLRVKPRSGRSSGDLTLTFGRRLREFAALADLAHQRSQVQVTGWDVGAKEPIAEKVDDRSIQSELEGLTGGSAVLGQALGERTEQIVHAVPLSGAEAEAMAAAAYRRDARRFVTGAGICEGDGRLRVGTYLTLQGLGPLFEGRYYVSEVRHLFDQQGGYRTHFRVERPGIGGG